MWTMKDNVNLVSFQAATEEKKSLGLQRRSIPISRCRWSHLASNQVNTFWEYHITVYELFTYGYKNFTEIHISKLKVYWSFNVANFSQCLRLVVLSNVYWNTLKTPHVVYLSFLFGRSIHKALRSQWNIPMNIFWPRGLDLDLQTRPRYHTEILIIHSYCRKFYGIKDSFAVDQMMVRCKEGKKRNIYFTSKEIKTITECNADRVKVSSLLFSNTNTSIIKLPIHGHIVHTKSKNRIPW